MSDAPTDDRTVMIRRDRRPIMSTSAIISGVVGTVLLVLAIVALARTGIPADDVTAPVVTVGPFARTPLFGLIELVVGLLALAAAADRDVRGALFLAVITGVFGIVWLIEPGAFNGVLGVTAATGWLYVAVAVALLVAVALDRIPPR